MTQSGVECILTNLVKGTGENYSAETPQYQMARYSMQVIWENISKFMVTGFIAYLLGILNYFIFFAIVYGILKMFAYGAHLDSSILCTLLGAIIYYGSIYLAHVNIPQSIYLILFITGFFIYLKYAPASSKWQSIKKSRHMILKRYVLIAIVALYILQFFLDNIYRNLILFAILAEAINLLPLIFKIFEGRGKIEHV